LLITAERDGLDRAVACFRRNQWKNSTSRKHAKRSTGRRLENLPS
jgi:hypothetical protein